MPRKETLVPRCTLGNSCLLPEHGSRKGGRDTVGLTNTSDVSPLCLKSQTLCRAWVSGAGPEKQRAHRNLVLFLFPSPHVGPVRGPRPECPWASGSWRPSGQVLSPGSLPQLCSPARPGAHRLQEMPGAKLQPGTCQAVWMSVRQPPARSKGWHF